MKVNINITVEFDPAEWTTTFGVEGEAEIRKDVKDYIGGQVAQVGAFGTGEITVKSVSWK